jgi:hypothetical protein
MTSPEFSAIPEKLCPRKVFLEDQSLSLTDGQHFYQETKASLSAPPQKCTQCSKCQWQVYTAFQREQEPKTNKKMHRSKILVTNKDAFIVLRSRPVHLTVVEVTIQQDSDPVIV